MTIHETDTLYECKECGILVREPGGKCPCCGKSDSGTVEYPLLEGGTVEKKRRWYNTIRLRNNE